MTLRAITATMHMGHAAGNTVLVPWPAHIVGTSCVDLDAETLNEAILLAGDGGVFTLHPQQLAQLGQTMPALVSSIAGIAPARVVASFDVEHFNGGCDWLGTYATERLTVGVCSRRALPLVRVPS